jgi:flagellar export protein FliJ
MKRHDSLTVVLAVRQRKEEVEERKLAGLGEQLLGSVSEVQRLDAELVSLTATRNGKVQQLLSGAHHHQNHAHYQHLQDQRARAVKEIQRVEMMRNEQLAIYLAARCGREVISELLQRRASEYDAERRIREQKRNEDLFLSRRVRS